MVFKNPTNKQEQYCNLFDLKFGFLYNHLNSNEISSPETRVNTV